MERFLFILKSTFSIAMQGITIKRTIAIILTFIFITGCESNNSFYEIYLNKESTNVIRNYSYEELNDRFNFNKEDLDSMSRSDLTSFFAVHDLGEDKTIITIDDNSLHIENYIPYISYKNIYDTDDNVNEEALYWLRPTVKQGWNVLYNDGFDYTNISSYQGLAFYRISSSFMFNENLITKVIIPGKVKLIVSLTENNIAVNQKGNRVTYRESENAMATIIVFEFD